MDADLDAHAWWMGIVKSRGGVRVSVGKAR